MQGAIAHGGTGGLEQFASRLLRSISPILPAEVTGSVDGCVIALAGPEGHFAAIDLAVGVDRVTPDVLAARAEHFLDRLQDYVMGILAHGWPGVDAKASGNELPISYAHVHGSRIDLGFARGEVRIPLTPLDI